MRRSTIAAIAAVSTIAFMQIASAADLPRKAPDYAPPPLPAIYNWTGFYVGGNFGGVWSDGDAERGSFFASTGALDFAGRIANGGFPNFNLNNAGVIAGGQIGYNWQFAPNWMVGLEADINYTGIDETKTVFIPPTGIFIANTYAAQQQLRWLGTVRGRLGYAWDRWLLFATGGLAYGEVRNSLSTIGIPQGAGLPANVSALVTSSDTKVGWTVGGGLEFAFTGNWSAKVEYLYFDLGSENLFLNYSNLVVPSGPTGINYNFDTKGQIARLGVNYRF